MQETSVDTQVVDDATQPYLGQWNRLISTTNWEKGRIITEWRQALIDAGASASDYSDEAWSRKAGGITGQHAGRLRRVHDRFGEVHEQYEGLYWSHFQGALDWDDAEMWLEGAIQNEWSVSAMRRQRWETLGALEKDRPRDEDIVATELDEDYTAEDSEQSTPDSIAGSVKEIRDEQQAQKKDSSKADDDSKGASIYADDDDQSIPFVRPFEDLPQLPADLHDAFESFKLAIIRHKAAEWRDITLDDLLASLDALKELATARADSDTSI